MQVQQYLAELIGGLNKQVCVCVFKPECPLVMVEWFIMGCLAIEVPLWNI